MTRDDGRAELWLPHEFLPLPEKGEIVRLRDRAGEIVGEGEVRRVRHGARLDRTAIVHVLVPERPGDGRPGDRGEAMSDDRRTCAGEAPGDDLLVCRCEEISRAEIMAAIDEGITTMSGLRRRLRIGMGLCQGRTCRRLLAQVLAERLGEQPADVRPGTFRPPVRPVSLRALADEREAPLPPRRAGAPIGARDRRGRRRRARA